jgi:hypothetical protein
MASTRTPGAEHGQATVELVALLPLMAVLAAVLWQAVVAGQAAPTRAPLRGVCCRRGSSAGSSYGPNRDPTAVFASQSLFRPSSGRGA